MHNISSWVVFPDYTKTFILDTDASNEGIGAVLSQVHDGSFDSLGRICISTPYRPQLSDMAAQFQGARETVGSMAGTITGIQFRDNSSAR